MDRKTLKLLVKESAKVGGFRARNDLLAYAMQRGVPYRVLELSRGEHNVPSATRISEILGCAPETAKAWLLTPATEEMIRGSVHERAVYLAAKAERTRTRKASRKGMTDALRLVDSAPLGPIQIITPEIARQVVADHVARGGSEGDFRDPPE